MQLPDTITIETSGSEGKPRQITLSAETLYASARMGQAIEDLQAGDCWLNCLSPNHIGGQAIAYRCAAAGATMRSHPQFDSQRIASELALGAITHLSLVPVMLSRLLEQMAGHSPAPQLRTVLIGGDRLPKLLALRAVRQGWPLLVGYGMTETASRVTLLRLTTENVEGWEEHDVGPPLPGVELSIGTQGEIRIRSERLFPGEGREIVTGDRGEIDERGHLHVHGRLDHQILSAGVLIDPLSVEQQLQQCSEIEQIGVTSVKDSQWGEVVVAVVEYPLSETALHWIRQHLSSAVRPRRFKVVEQLRYCGVGKLDRRWLRQVVADVA